MIYGVTPQGFFNKPFDIRLKEEREKLTTKIQALHSDWELDFSPYSFLGIMTVIDAQRGFDHGEDTEAVYYSNYIDTSDGIALDRIIALRGESRYPAKKSIVTLTFTGTVGVTLPSSVICETESGEKFITTESKVFVTSTVDVIARAIKTGVNGNVPAGSITKIVTTVSGVDSVTNAIAALGGRAIETDAEVRARMKLPFKMGGSSAPALQAMFNGLTGVLNAKVFENNTDATVGSMTPHSVRAVIEGGTLQDIGEVFLQYKPCGIETMGNLSLSIIDDENLPRIYKYDVPSNVTIYCTSNFVIDTTSVGAPASASAWLSKYGAQAKENIIKTIGGTGADGVYSGSGISVDIEAWKINASQIDIPWIKGVITTYVGKTASPTADRVDLTDSERGITDTAKVVINAS